jgi:hypothetical protein
MKKFSLIFLLIVFCGFALAEDTPTPTLTPIISLSKSADTSSGVYPSHVYSVLELDNNIVDLMGNTNWVNTGATFHSNIKKYGNHSAGFFNNSYRINTSPNFPNNTLHSVQLYFRLTSSSANQDRIVSFSGVRSVALGGDRQLYVRWAFVDYFSGVDKTLSNDVWYRLNVDYAPDKIKFYINGDKWIEVPPEPYFTYIAIGNYTSDTSALNGYIDRVILSTTTTGGAETKPIWKHGDTVTYSLNYSVTNTAENVVIYDTIPDNIEFVGSTGGTLTAGVVYWNEGTTTNAFGVIRKWWGTLKNTLVGLFTNTAVITADGMPTIEASEEINVASPTATVTPTVTPTITPTVTETVTETNTQTVTETVTPTITQTITETVTPTITQTITLTATPIIKPAIHSDENNGGIWHRFRMWFNHNNLLPHNIYADFYAIKYDEVA